MDIYPQDLGEARLARLTQAGKRWPSRPMLAVLAVCAAVTVALIGLEIHSGLPFPFVIFFWPCLLMRSTLGREGRRLKAGTTAPLRPAAVQGLILTCLDPLERQYLGLALAAVQMPKRPEAPAQTEIREAVRALGAALDHVPPMPTILVESASDLTVSAAGLAVDADCEGDPVVAASLRRRADARRQQAETIALLETQTRRGAALRAELSDEIASLQTSLTVLGAQGVWSVQEMADVAAGIGWIAIKAQGLAAAQAEMDEALHIHTLAAPLHDGPNGTRQRLSRYTMDDTEA